MTPGRLLDRGPIKKDKAFFFSTTSARARRASTSFSLTCRSTGLATLTQAPYEGNQLTGRIDYRINDKHSAFLRFSYDGNSNSGPFTAAVPTLPSNYVANKNYVWQGLLSVTSILSPRLVNDFRFSYGYWQNRNTPAPCTGDINGYCIGAGGPEVFYLNSVNFALGNNFNSPQGRDLRRYPVSDNPTWQRGATG